MKILYIIAFFWSVAVLLSSISVIYQEDQLEAVEHRHEIRHIIGESESAEGAIAREYFDSQSRKVMLSSLALAVTGFVLGFVSLRGLIQKSAPDEKVS